MCKQKEEQQMELMDEILSEENLKRAIKAVKSNKGAAGVDKMTVPAFTQGACVTEQERRSTGIDRPSLILFEWFAVTSAST